MTRILRDVGQGETIGIMAADGISVLWSDDTVDYAGRALKRVKHGFGGTIHVVGTPEQIAWLFPHADKVQEGVQCLVKAELLRGYQGQLVEDALLGEPARGYLRAPAGAGKTRVAAAIVAVWEYALAGQRRSPWAYLVQSKTLAAQTEKAIYGGGKAVMWEFYKALGMEPNAAWKMQCFSFGEVWRGNAATGAPGTRYAEFLECQGGLICDECHKSPCPTFSVPVFLSRAVCRIGMSATPTDREDKTGTMVDALFGPELARVGVQEVIEAGGLTPGKVWTGVR